MKVVEGTTQYSYFFYPQTQRSLFLKKLSTDLQLDTTAQKGARRRSDTYRLVRLSPSHTICTKMH